MESLRLTYNSSISGIRELNSSFDTGVLQICYPGKNRNKTYFSKDTLVKGIPTMFNCPVVANYSRETGDLGGHDIEVITDYDNTVRVVNITQPVGVVPAGTNVYFKDVEEADGTHHEYLFADVILWKRQEAYKSIKENGIVGQSMEVTVLDGERIDDVYIVNDFEFTAFALLGSTVEPCFESASLQTFSTVGSEFKAEFAEMMSEFKESFNLATTSPNEVEDKISQEGGCRLENEKLEQFENTEETVEEPVVEEPVEEVADEPAQETVEEEFALNSNLSEAIYDAFAGETMMTEWGEMRKYCIADYDVDNSMVYVWDCADWLLYGFSYVMDGDNVVVDFDSKKRMKYAIVEFNEGDAQNSPFAFAIEQAVESIKKSNENVSELESKYQEMSSQMDSMNTELNELRLFKSSVEAASDKAQRDELFAQFADLSDVEEFMALVADSSAYDLNALEEKCFAIRGRNMKLNFSAKDVKAPKLPITPSEHKPDEKLPYGGVVEKYRD